MVSRAPQYAGIGLFCYCGFGGSYCGRYSQNKSRVNDIPSESTGGRIVLTDPGSNSYRYSLIEGRPFGVIEGFDFKRDDQGRILVNDDNTLQRTDWKEIGNAGQRNEQRLWKQFRGACDVFFDHRQKHFEAADAEFETNLAAKNEIIGKINAYAIPEDKKQALNDLKQFASDFNAVGKVPMKQKDAVYNAFKTALDKHYAELKLEGDEKHKVMFQARLDTLAGSPDSGRLFAREKADLRKRIDQFNHDVLQLENNLGFFSKSKGADALKKEVEKKIEKAKEEIVAIRQKIKLIPNE